MRYDLAIIGSGAAGFAAAITAVGGNGEAGGGARVVMIDRGETGGTCVNVHDRDGADGAAGVDGGDRRQRGGPGAGAAVRPSACGPAAAARSSPTRGSGPATRGSGRPGTPRAARRTSTPPPPRVPSPPPTLSSRGYGGSSPRAGRAFRTGGGLHRPAPCHVHQPGDRVGRPHRGRTGQVRGDVRLPGAAAEGCAARDREPGHPWRGQAGRRGGHRPHPGACTPSPTAPRR
jgi:hypothetical protein